MLVVEDNKLVLSVAVILALMTWFKTELEYDGDIL